MCFVKHVVQHFGGNIILTVKTDITHFGSAFRVVTKWLKYQRLKIFQNYKIEKKILTAIYIIATVIAVYCNYFTRFDRYVNLLEFSPAYCFFIEIEKILTKYILICEEPSSFYTLFNFGNIQKQMH